MGSSSGATDSTPHPGRLPTHPNDGPRDPRRGMPSLEPGTVRRTTCVDTLSPDGLDGPMLLVATARDLVVGADGEATVVGTASLTVEMDRTDRIVSAIELDPPHPGASHLLGIGAGPGFRREVDRALADLVGSGDLRYQLLDDLPGTSLVGRYASAQSGEQTQLLADSISVMVDQCAGWVDGGGFVQNLLRPAGRSIPLGPTAPTLHLEEPGFHTIGAVAPDSMRRIRRIDLHRCDDGTLALDAHFRDSHADGALVGTVLHEYSLTAILDADAHRFVDAVTTPHVLPWSECPRAAASSHRIAGRSPGELRRWVRTELTGVSTCTHLNDTLRALADVPSLAGLLPSPARAIG